MRNSADFRREAAQKEIGHTLVSRSVSITSIVLFCLGIAVVPMVQHIAEIRQLKLPKVYDVFRLLPMPSEEDIEAYEDTLEEESVVSNWILPRAHSLFTRYLQVGNEQAYIGRDGWLFYRSDIDSLIGRGFLDSAHQSADASDSNSSKTRQTDPIKAITNFNRQLTTRGIRLIVMPTPLKPTIHPEKFTNRYIKPNTPVRNPSFVTFVAALASAGMMVFDPTQILFDAAPQGDQYLRTDTHWTPDAMERTAIHLAQFIREQVELSLPPSVSYTRTAVEVTNLGDIAKMLNLPEGQTTYPPERTTLHAVQTPSGKPWKPDRGAEILFLGDSFSNIYSLAGMGWGGSAGFVEQLSAALQRPIDKIVINAGGAYATRHALSYELRRDENRLAGKRLVIYQFAARELFSGDWKLLDLPILSSIEPAEPQH